MMTEVLFLGELSLQMYYFLKFWLLRRINHPDIESLMLSNQQCMLYFQILSPDIWSWLTLTGLAGTFSRSREVKRGNFSHFALIFRVRSQPYTCGEQVSGFNKCVIAVDTTNAMRYKWSSLAIKPAGSRQRWWEFAGCTLMESWRREEKINCVMAEYQLP